LFDIVTNGMGLMPSYRWPIPLRTGGRSSLTYEISSATAGTATPPPRARRRSTPPPLEATADKPADSPRTPSEEGTVANGAMNGVLNRRVLFVVGPFTGLVMFASVVMIARSDEP
jgi:hypothetical protein